MNTWIAGFLAVAALAADGPKFERGMVLFNSTQLGSNGKSCATCHLDGKGLGKHVYTEAQLKKIVNACIEKSLDGKALPLESANLRSLVMYVNHLMQQ